MGGPFELRLSRQGGQALRRVDVQTRVRLGRTLDRLQRDPFDSSWDIRPVKGQPGVWWVRVGDWRILYEVDLLERIIRVLVISLRGAAYR